MTRLGQTVDDLERANAAVGRTFSILERKSAIDEVDPSDEVKLPPPTEGRSVELRGVNFSYATGDGDDLLKPVLRDFSLNIRSGEVCIVCLREAEREVGCTCTQGQYLSCDVSTSIANVHELP